MIFRSAGFNLIETLLALTVLSIALFCLDAAAFKVMHQSQLLFQIEKAIQALDDFNEQLHLSSDRVIPKWQSPTSELIFKFMDIQQTNSGYKFRLTLTDQTTWLEENLLV